MRPVTRHFEEHPVFHGFFCLVFFSGFLILARLLPGFEGISPALGPVIGGLAFVSSRAGLTRNRTTPDR